MWIAWQSATVPNMSISDVLQSEWRWRRGPRGEEDTHNKDGVLLKNFDPLRFPKRYQDPVFFRLKDTNSYITHYLPASYFFRFSIPKGIAKAPALDLLRLNTLRATKTSFLTPERYNEVPRSGGRGQEIQTAPCSSRVDRVFSLYVCMKKWKLQSNLCTTTSPQRITSLQWPLFSFRRTITLILISLYNGHLSTTATATKTRPSCHKNLFTTAS